MTSNLTKLAQSLEWQSIKSAPKDGTVILGRNKSDPYDKHGSTVCWYNGSYESHWVYEAETDPVEGLTHWMPLPTGNAGEVIRILAEALNAVADDYDDRFANGALTPRQALARAEQLAGGGE
jgi:hypothetical protein